MSRESEQIPARQGSWDWNRALFKDFLLYGFLNSVSKASGLLVLPVLTRVLTLEEYGVVDLITVGITTLAMLIALSLPAGILRYFLEEQEPRDQARLVSSAAAIVLLAGAVSFGIAAIVLIFIPGTDLGGADVRVLVVLTLGNGILNALSRISTSVLRLQRRIVAVNSIDLISSAATVILTLFLVLVLEMGVLGVALAWFMASVVRIVLAIWVTREFLVLEFPAHLMGKLLRFCLPLVPAAAVGMLNRQIDRLLILAFLGFEDIAIYGVVARVALLIEFPGNVFDLSWSAFSMTLLNEPVAERDRYFGQILDTFTTFFIGAAIAALMVAPELFSALVPVEYHAGIWLLPWIMGARVLYTSSAITGRGVLIAETTGHNVRAGVLSLALNATLSTLLVFNFGLAGVAFGTFAGELIFTSFLAVKSQQATGIVFEGRKNLLRVAGYLGISFVFLMVGGLVEGSLLWLVCRLLLCATSIAIVARALFRLRKK